ncbi:hypothetical protein HSB1_41320 [Halogranum salarium B-1]|uniref:Uncharacterized protein n=1 Tax=Halogranum salarium B-1 TaxID=1210908 RepID=J3JDF5_9EURY|nr:hypothetical protein HSB1_41320 [Halogranum salarium B-1]
MVNRFYPSLASGGVDNMVRNETVVDDDNALTIDVPDAVGRVGLDFGQPLRSLD